MHHRSHDRGSASRGLGFASMGHGGLHPRQEIHGVRACGMHATGMHSSFFKKKIIW